MLRKIWTEDDVDFRGDFYRIHDFTLKPKPLNTPERPNPEIFQGGNSTAARRNGGRYSDWYFSNGKDFDGVTEQVVEVRDHAREREPRGAVRAQRLHHRPRHREGSEGHPPRDHRQGQPARRRGLPRRRAAGRQLDRRQAAACGRTPSFEDLVQYNDGFRTQLIGTPEQIAERIAAYRKRGVDLILGGFLHFQEEIEYFGAQRAAAGARNRSSPKRIRVDAPVLVSA